jgi:hypothetical protein
MFARHVVSDLDSAGDDALDVLAAHKRLATVPQQREEAETLEAVPRIALVWETRVADRIGDNAARWMFGWHAQVPVAHGLAGGRGELPVIAVS